MKSLTILREAAWISLNDRGYLICDDEALGDDDYLPAYQWMIDLATFFWTPTSLSGPTLLKVPG